MRMDDLPTPELPINKIFSEWSLWLLCEVRFPGTGVGPAKGGGGLWGFLLGLRGGLEHFFISPKRL